MLDDAQPPRARLEQVADAAAAMAEMPPRLRVRQEAADLIMGIGGAQRLDQRPERGQVGGAVGPAGEIGVAVGKGEARREIEADHHVGARVGSFADPGEDFRARPDMPWPHQFGRRGAARDGEGDAMLAKPARARPVDRGEICEMAHDSPVSLPISSAAVLHKAARRPTWRPC